MSYKLSVKTQPSFRVSVGSVISLFFHDDILIVYSCILQFQHKKAVDLQDFPNLDWTDLPVEHLRCRLKEVEIKGAGKENKEMDQLVAYIFGEDAVITNKAFMPTFNSLTWKATE